MDNKDLFAAMNAEAEKLKAKQPKKEKVVIKHSVPNTQPWDDFPDYLKSMFDQIVKSDSEAEARKDKGRPKSGYQIKLDAYNYVQFVVKNLEQSVVITEANLALAFNHYTDDELAHHIECGKKFIRLKDGDGYRVVDIEEIKASIAEDDDFTFKLIELSLNEPEKTKQLVKERITAIIKAEIAQIKVDYQDLLTGA